MSTSTRPLNKLARDRGWEPNPVRILFLGERLAEKQFERRIEGRHEKCVGTVQAQRAVATMTLKAGPSSMGQAGMAAESEVSITLAVARRRLFDLADWSARATTHTTP